MTSIQIEEICLLTGICGWRKDSLQSPNPTKNTRKIELPGTKARNGGPKILNMIFLLKIQDLGSWILATRVILGLWMCQLHSISTAVCWLWDPIHKDKLNYISKIEK